MVRVGSKAGKSTLTSPTERLRPVWPALSVAQP